MSAGPPAANGTTMRTVFAGQACAITPRGRTVKIAANRLAVMRRMENPPGPILLVLRVDYSGSANVGRAPQNARPTRTRITAAGRLRPGRGRGILECTCVARQDKLLWRFTMKTRTQASIAAAVFALALGGCSDMSPTEKVTVAGAAVGGLAGSAISGGSAAGTIGGGVVGGVDGDEGGERRGRRQPRFSPTWG